MLAPALVEEIRRLLAEGRWSQREIARRLRVSRGTVGAIALGRRRQPPPPQNAEEPPVPRGLSQRCSSCGGMVYLPCRACRLRAALVQQPRPYRTCAEPDEPLTLNLRPQHHARYEAVHARKLAESPLL